MFRAGKMETQCRIWQSLLNWLIIVIEILCFGFTIAAVIFRSKENISAGFVVVPLFMTVVCSIALIINARGYVWNIQRK